MNMSRPAALAATVLLFSASALSASATTLEITGAGIYSTNQLDVNGANEYATALDLTVQGSVKPLWVFCVDLSHSIYVNIGSQLGYSPPLTYATHWVTTNSDGATSGSGPAISQTTSGEIATLANEGSWIANKASPDFDRLTAIQGAIWEVEYGLTPSQVTGTPSQNTLIASYVANAEAHPAAGYASGIYPTGANGVGFGGTQGFATGVPEPTTWAMMLVGLGLMGATLRDRARALSLATIPAARTTRR